MNKKSTRRKGTGRSEQLLLIAIMAVGILGLTFSYGTKKIDAANSSASSSDTTSSNGKVQNDRMILHLNQKGKETPESTKVARF